LYFRGPFLYFLRRHPQEAIDAIIQLVNFATDRWKDNLGKHEELDLKLSINFKKKTINLTGDSQVYYWFRDGGNAPNAIVSALMALEKYLYDLIDEGQEIEPHVNQILESSRSLSLCGLLISVGIKKPELFLGLLEPLLLIPEFHFWDLSYSIHPKDHLMWGWELEPKTLQKLAFEWHNLQLRKWNLESLSKYLFFNYPDFEDVFKELKKTLKKLVPQFSKKSSFRIFLENRIALYDKKNYDLITDENGKEFWKYLEPEELSKRNQLRRKKDEEYQLLLNFPFICRNILSGKSKFDKAGVDDFISNIKRIDSIRIKGDHLVNQKNALSGGIAVLLLKYSKISLSNPDLETWCIDKIINIIINPPEDDELLSSVDFYDMRWDSFCAEVLPVIWVKNKNSRKIRECVSKVVTRPYYKTIDILFSTASKQRKNLGLDWMKLQNFVLMYSTIRANYSRYEKNDDNFHYLRNELCSEFIKDKISADFVSLNSVYEYLPKTIYNNLKSMNKRFGLIDLQLITSVYSWMIREKFWEKKSESSNWISTWTDFFEFTINKIRERKPRRDNDHGSPDMWDRWVFDYLPILITRIEDENECENFWKPILEMGNPYHYYIEDFFNAWFINYFKHVELKKEAEIKEKFIKNWKAMIDFVLHCKTWKFNEQKRWYHIDDMALGLIGLDSMYFDFWIEELDSLVEVMKDYYYKWMNEYLVYSRCAAGLINFLQQPAARSILLEGIVWIKEGYEKHLNYWDENDIVEPLSHLLNTIWTKHQQGIRKNDASFEAFKFLLNKLVEKQNPLALEIFNQIV